MTAEIAHAAATLFPETVAVAVRDIADPAEIRAEEAPAITRAVPARRAEFAAGRDAARTAMARLGHPPVAVPQAPDRAPIWPPGLVGSITHTRRADGLGIALAACAFKRKIISLGLDAEPDAPLPEDLWPVILTRVERAALMEGRTAHATASARAGHTLPPARMARTIFSAKEALYKAQYPLSRALLDFQDVEIDLQPRTFTATFAVPAPPFEPGHTLSGQWTEVGGVVLTAVSLVKA